MKTMPKHHEISSYLETEIAAGRYKDGARLPSEMQLVQKFGVSRPTVARALRDLESKDLIDRRAGSGTYVRSNQQRTVTTRILGLLVPGLATTEIFQIICGEIASLARVNDYGLLWGGSTNPRVDTDASLKHAEEICKQFIERKVSGVFFAPAELQPGQEEANTHLAESLREAGIPAVLQAVMQCLGPHAVFGIVGIAPPGTPVPGDMGQVMTFGHTIKGIIEGDSDPDEFIPQLMALHAEGRLPLEKLVKTFPKSYFPPYVTLLLP